MIAGPGFINLTLEAAGLGGRAAHACCAKARPMAAARSGAAEKVNVEYVSANPTGPMHVGHCRGAVFGDALASLLAFAGYDVTREYYINDAGAQVDVLARSAFLRYREALGENIGEIPEGLYPGDYLKPVGAGAGRRAWRQAARRCRKREWLPIVRATAIAMMMDDDQERSRRAQHQARCVLLRALADRGAATTASPRPSITCARRATSTKAACRRRRARRSRITRTASRRCSAPPPIGDDVDRPLLKSDGSYTYFASDIAYHKNKFDRGFRNMIDVWGADHGGYIKRMQAAVKAVTVGQGGARRQDRAARQVAAQRRAGEDVETLRRFRHAARGGRRGRLRRRALHDAVPQERRGAGFRPRQGDRAVQGQPGLLRPVRPRPRPFGVQNAREVVPDLPEETAARAAFLGDAAVERLTDPAELEPAAAARALSADDRGGGGRHTSRTESLFISMISPANFTRCGPGAAICPIYASLSIMMQRSQRRGWRWSRASSRFWHRA